MNYIIGSGLIAFLAKYLLPNFHIIPLGKSRYYQFEVATCDDYIFCHPKIDDVMSQLASQTNMKLMPIFFKRALSYSGQIIFYKQEGFFNSWVNKVYQGKSHPLISNLTKFDGFVYNIAGTDLFKPLEATCKKDFVDFIRSNNKLVAIDTQNKIIQTIHSEIPYENIISTIPLNAIFKFCGNQTELEARDMHTFVVETNDLNFEGASELLVVDDNIDFFKCTRIARKVYQFYCTAEIINLSKYLNLFMNSYDILSATVVRKAIPLGDHRQHRALEAHGIYCVGSNAQWDDMMDLSSCIARLINISNAF